MEFRIGSCRINSNKYLQNHVHNTKQIILTIQFLLDLNIDNDKYNLILTENDNLLEYKQIKEQFKKSKVLIIEISSLKIWKNNEHELISWKNYNKNKKNNENYYEIQNENKFLLDLQNIYNLTKNKKLIFFSHINIPINNFKNVVSCNDSERWITNNFIKKGEKYNENDNLKINNINSKFITNRNNIENYINKFVIKNKEVIHLKPYELLKNSKYNLSELFIINNNSLDINHYSQKGHEIINNKIKSFII